MNTSHLHLFFVFLLVVGCYGEQISFRIQITNAQNQNFWKHDIIMNTEIKGDRYFIDPSEFAKNVASFCIESRINIHKMEFKPGDIRVIIPDRNNIELPIGSYDYMKDLFYPFINEFDRIFQGKNGYKQSGSVLWKRWYRDLGIVPPEPHKPLGGFEIFLIIGAVVVVLALIVVGVILWMRRRKQQRERSSGY